MSARRAAAIGALLLGFGGFGLAVVVAVQEFPRGLIALACITLAAAAAWYGVLRRGAVRVAGLSVGALGLGAAILLLVGDRLLEEVLIVAALALSCAAARAAFGVRAQLPQVPYACVPAGTRNHFALDLGVDRDDVVGALDAFVDGGERRVDLAEVNGRVFVNNVSLGLYADAVQRKGYRDAKLRTLLDTVPDMLGPDGTGLDLRWTGPGGHEHSSGAAILVSNNRYRLGHAVGSGTRPRIDDGRLGITIAGAPTGRGGGHLPQRPWREWTAPVFEVDAHHPVPAGIDGEAAELEPPLRFHIRPGVLRVRIARLHPGASPSAMLPEGVGQSARALARIAAGRDPVPIEPTTKESSWTSSR
jgi:hypothetical protein